MEHRDFMTENIKLIFDLYLSGQSVIGLSENLKKENFLAYWKREMVKEND